MKRLPKRNQSNRRTSPTLLNFVKLRCALQNLADFSKLSKVTPGYYRNQYVSGRTLSEYREVQRIHLCPAETKYGCQIPKGAWHTVSVIEPSVIFEAKYGAYKPQ